MKSALFFEIGILLLATCSVQSVLIVRVTECSNAECTTDCKDTYAPVGLCTGQGNTYECVGDDGLYPQVIYGGAADCRGLPEPPRNITLCQKVTDTDRYMKGSCEIQRTPEPDAAGTMFSQYICDNNCENCMKTDQTVGECITLTGTEQSYKMQCNGAWGTLTRYNDTTCTDPAKLGVEILSSAKTCIELYGKQVQLLCDENATPKPDETPEPAATPSPTPEPAATPEPETPAKVTISTCTSTDCAEDTCKQIESEAEKCTATDSEDPGISNVATIVKCEENGKIVVSVYSERNCAEDSLVINLENSKTCLVASPQLANVSFEVTCSTSVLGFSMPLLIVSFAVIFLSLL